MTIEEQIRGYEELCIKILRDNGRENRIGFLRRRIGRASSMFAAKQAAKTVFVAESLPTPDFDDVRP